MRQKTISIAIASTLIFSGGLSSSANAVDLCTSFSGTKATENLCEVLITTTSTWTVPDLPYGQNFDILVAGAGGAGGVATLSGSYTEVGGGGGGGGEVALLEDQNLAAGSQISVTVGTGGIAGANPNGGQSSFGNTTADGGLGANGATGGASGSGATGGASADYGTTLVPGGGAGVYNGDDAVSLPGSFYASGGGGAGQPANLGFFDGSAGGGVPKTYGSGGSSGLGSSFGSAAFAPSGGGTGATATTDAVAPTANLGGGGGGGYTNGSTTRNPSNGADGVVAIRFLVTPLTTLVVDKAYSENVSLDFTEN